MNVLSISQQDSAGGAALAAYRLHQEFCRRDNIEARMLVGEKYTSDDTVVPLYSSDYGKYLNKAVGRAFEEVGLQGLYYPSTRRLASHHLINEWADIVLLRNIHGNYMSYRAIPRLSKSATIVWRLPDMWSLTGGCYYAYDCNRWQTGCGNCPQLGADVDFPWDSTGLLWKLKKRAYDKSSMNVVSPSRWLAEILEQSPLLGQFPIDHIPTGADIDIFSPMKTDDVRALLDIPIDNPTIIFCASTLSDSRKGSDILANIIQNVVDDNCKTISLLLVGSQPQDLADELSDLSGVQVYTIGEVRNDRFLALCYNAADVLALPTLADNLPNVLIESMACGTPVVTFNNGGCSEPITNGESGFVVPDGDIKTFASVLSNILTDDRKRRGISKRSREEISKNYSMTLQADRYLSLFGNII